ncbi:hypothetical protein [Streptomyces malaysiensis]
MTRFSSILGHPDVTISDLETTRARCLQAVRHPAPGLEADPISADFADRISDEIDRRQAAQ